MPDTTTTNYALTKPDPGGSSNTWGVKLNADLDALDGVVKTTADAVASKLPSASYTADDVFAKVLTKDGSGSGLDADTLDGFDASAFASAGHVHTAYVGKVGDTMSGNLNREGAGAHIYYVDAAFISPRVFVTVAGAADPTSQPGDLWFELS